MRRRCKICDDIPAAFTPKETKVTKEFEFELITPMFGGGARSWELDLESPVRGQAVKGQLRFWWRTMQNIEDYQALLLKENEIFGGPISDICENGNRIKSPVTLQIIHNTIKADDIVSSGTSHIIPQNVLFPVTTGSNKDNLKIKLIKTFSFTLKITYPEPLEGQVINTLKLWTLFGGVGARTRRGTGSLYCEELLREFKDEKTIRSFLCSLSKSETDEREYSRIAGAQLFTKTTNGSDASSSWYKLLEAFKNYRQDRTGRNNQGRSCWPEPDAIRRLTGDHSPNHHPSHPDGLWFPRAAFGLPIISRFTTPGDPGHPVRGERDQYQLEPDSGTGDRYPSPVILKVIKLPDDTILQCALVLNQKFPEQLTLKTKRWRKNNITKNMLPLYEGYRQDNKTMRTSSPLNGKTIYQDLASHLGLKEVL